MTASRKAKARLVAVLAMTVVWTTTGPSARAAACPMREMQMRPATVHCHETGGAPSEQERSEHDCCKKTGHACCFKAPRNGTPTTNVSVDAPRVAAVLPAATPIVSGRHFVRLPPHRPVLLRSALAPPVLRL